MEERLKAHSHTEDVLYPLGVDFRSVTVPFTGSLKSALDGVFHDMWGIGYRRVDHGRGGAYDEAVVLPLAELKTLDDVENYPWPRPEQFDYSGVAEACEKLKDYCICCGHAGIPDILNGVSRGRGMERVMMDIALRDEVGMAIIRKRCDIWYELLRRTLAASQGRIDIVCLGEDMGNQRGRMFSPRDFDDVFRPELQRFINLAHEFGAKAMLHSCGDTHEIMPALIEMGLDILDAMQPEPAGMDLETIRSICKGKLAFCGLISTQQTLPYGSAAECRAEARHRLHVIARGGGYIFAPAHCIQTDTPLENILAIYEEALSKKLM